MTFLFSMSPGPLSGKEESSIPKATGVGWAPNPARTSKMSDVSFTSHAPSSFKSHIITALFS